MAAAPAAAGPVVVFGDSLAVGVAGRLRRAGYPVVDLGRVGWGLNRSDWLQRIDRLRDAAAGADAVVIFIGTNDQAMEEGLYASRLATMRAAVPAGTPVVWLGQPNFCRADLVAGAPPIDAALRRTAARFGDTMLRPVGGCGDGSHAPDGVHYTLAGYSDVADQVAAALPGDAGPGNAGGTRYAYAYGPASFDPPLLLSRQAGASSRQRQAEFAPVAPVPARRGAREEPARDRQHLMAAGARYEMLLRQQGALRLATTQFPARRQLVLASPTMLLSSTLPPHPLAVPPPRPASARAADRQGPRAERPTRAGRQTVAVAATSSRPQGSATRHRR
ncbi:GDSL-type esterase/lipase family protein [Roseomonas sp. NAR14]|uniref:GDSL-type esterase/lipase family protein n=1 Tax=Roseomonas acroporae TaxID=2937791 RepID=A0A9X1Y5L5_9PROT|nr:GDSL-type esterase/lipase family protein [Roseomonas acroporae]MCK8783873.1 GDSL-type esterase/lipase family protein [Roseomonas acroporae]